MHINNLYKNKDILLFKECYAMEKIHGTSANITFKPVKIDEVEHWKLVLFPGGEKYENFAKLFNEEFLLRIFCNTSISVETTIWGEAYGGRQQGMRDTYGDKLKFIAFEVTIGERWLNVPDTEEFCKQFEIEFVHYEKVSTDLELLDKLANSPSVQAKRNGIIGDKLREGIVLRPLIELRKNSEERIIAKHKNEKFKEREHQPKLNQLTLEQYTETKKIVDEWVTFMRLQHVLDKFPSAELKDIPKIIKAMQEDVLREGKDEILISENNKELFKEIGKKTASLFKQHLSKNSNL